jgi:hypothetical protein
LISYLRFQGCRHIASLRAQHDLISGNAAVEAKETRMIETVLTGLLVALALYGFARIIIADCKGDWEDEDQLS